MLDSATCLECPRGRMALCKERKKRKKAGPSVWSSLSKSEMVAIMVDSQNLKSVTPEPVDNEILLQLEALSRRYCYRLHSKRLQLYRNLSI